MTAAERCRRCTGETPTDSHHPRCDRKGGIRRQVATPTRTGHQADSTEIDAIKSAAAAARMYYGPRDDDRLHVREGLWSACGTCHATSGEGWATFVEAGRREPRPVRSVVIQAETRRHKWRTVAWTPVLYADKHVVLVRQFGCEALYHPAGKAGLAGYRPDHPTAQNLPNPLWRWRLHPASVARLRAWLDAT